MTEPETSCFGKLLYYAGMLTRILSIADANQQKLPCVFRKSLGICLFFTLLDCNFSVEVAEILSVFAERKQVLMAMLQPFLVIRLLTLCNMASLRPSVRPSSRPRFSASSIQVSIFTALPSSIRLLYASIKRVSCMTAESSSSTGRTCFISPAGALYC